MTTHSAVLAILPVIAAGGLVHHLFFPKGVAKGVENVIQAKMDASKKKPARAKRTAAKPRTKKEPPTEA
jgi:hypothetical protein